MTDPQHARTDAPTPDAPVAVILAAGRGTRMREAADVALTPAQEAAADAGFKFLVPINGRRYLEYVLAEVVAAGFREIVLVVSPAVARALRGDERPLVAGAAGAAGAAGDRDPGPRVRFAIQREPRGGADAVLAAESAVGDRPFVVINADNVYPAAVLRRLFELDGPGLIAFDRDALVRESNIPADRIAAFAVVREEGGALAEIVEKPSRETLATLGDAPVSMTCWRFDASIFDACRAVAPSPRGELELPDAVALAARRGTRFGVVHAEAGVLDISRRDDIPALESLLAGRPPGP